MTNFWTIRHNYNSAGLSTAQPEDGSFYFVACCVVEMKYLALL